MKIQSIHIYSHDGQRRDLQFKVICANISGIVLRLQMNEMTSIDPVSVIFINKP